jgi:hypothetical protein
MKLRLIIHSVCLLAALLFSACEGPPQPRQTPFNEADFAKTRGAGSGSITGQGYIVMKNDSIRFLDTSIDLVPVNAYTTEIIQRRLIEGHNLLPADPRYRQYVRSAPADDHGRFAFHNLPSGDYYLGSSVDWRDWSWFTDNDNNMYKVWSNYAVPIYAQVTVKNGQTVRVTDWNYGKQRSY